MTTFKLNDRVFIKKAVTTDLRPWLIKARDERIALVVTAVDMTASPFQVRAELRFEDGDNVTARFSADELEIEIDPRRQSAFVAWMNCVGKGWSDLTTAERAEAAHLGFRVPTFTKVETVTRLPECMTYRALEMAWW